MLDITFVGKWSCCICYDMYCIFSAVPGFPVIALSGASLCDSKTPHSLVLWQQTYSKYVMTFPLPGHRNFIIRLLP